VKKSRSIGFGKNNRVRATTSAGHVLARSSVVVRSFLEGLEIFGCPEGIQGGTLTLSNIHITYIKKLQATVPWLSLAQGFMHTTFRTHHLISNLKKSGDQEWGNGGGKMIAVGELPAKAVGRINVYRIVQAKITSCYSTNEEKAERQKMKCVDRKEVKSCHTRRLHLPALDMEAVIKEETTGSGKYKNRFQNIKEDNMSKADAKSNQKHKMKKATKQIARWTKLMKEIALERFMDGFKNGVKQPTIHDVIHQPTMKGVFDQLNVEGTGSGMVWEWSECDELAEKVAISLA